MKRRYLAIPADIPKAISANPAPLPCRCGAGVPEVGRDCSDRVTWVACDACGHEEFDILDWDTWATYGSMPRPAPLPFTAPPEIPMDLSAVAAGVVEAITDLDLSLTAVRAAAFQAHYGLGWPTAEDLRGIADKLADLSEAAGQASRDVHDAIPDVVV